MDILRVPRKSDMITLVPLMSFLEEASPPCLQHQSHFQDSEKVSLIEDGWLYVTRWFILPVDPKHI